MSLLRNSYFRLAISVAGVGLIWGIALPRVALIGPIQQHLNFLEENKIDPSAMFYTELEAMEPILKRLECRDGIQTSAN